jgi:probable addiction module antidote protein
MSLKTKKYDVANYLDSDEMIAVYLDAAFESGDTSRIAEALGDVARARGTSIKDLQEFGWHFPIT